MKRGLFEGHDRSLFPGLGAVLNFIVLQEGVKREKPVSLIEL